MQEKYGFVYIWFDKKHKRYYIGCHWGNENDGYICSSNWMRDAYKRRPNDFKRRILKTNIINKKDLLKEEYKWLSLIKYEELRIKYYNLSKNNFEHSVNKRPLQTKEQISNKRSNSLKEYFSYPEVREKSSQKHKEIFSTPKMKLKMSEVRKKQWANTEFKEMMTEERRRRWENPEYRKKMTPGRDIERRREYMRNYMQIRRSKAVVS